MLICAGPVSGFMVFVSCVAFRSVWQRRLIVLDLVSADSTTIPPLVSYDLQTAHGGIVRDS